MRLHHLHLLNFMSHADTVIEFSRGLTMIFGVNLDYVHANRSIGAGKSSILEGISWVLWGRVPRKCVKNDVIQNGADGCIVELELHDDKDSLSITRSKSVKGSEKVEAIWNGQVILEPVQENLERIYGISFDVFCNTCFIGPQSDVVTFFTADPATRAATLGELLNDIPFQEAAKRVADEMARLEDDRKRLSVTIENLDQATQQLTGDIQRLHAAYAEEQGAQAKREAAVGQQAYDLELTIMKLQQALREGPKRSAAEVQVVVNLVDAEIQKTQVLRTVAYSRVHAAGCRVGEQCPTCGQMFTPQASADLDQMKTAYVKELQQAEQSLQILSGQRRDLESEMGTVRAWGQLRQQIEGRINETQQQIATLRGSLENRTLVVLHAEKEHVQSRLHETAILLAEKRKDLGAINLRMPHLKTLYQGFRHEIRNLLADDVRRVMEFYTAQYAQLLCENEFTGEFPAVTATGREKFDIVIRRNGNANRLTSGGESYFAEMAVLLALRKALMHQVKSPFEFLLLDDPLERCDDAGGRAFGALLQALTPEFSEILVTVPRAIEGLNGDQEITVVRQNRVSTI